MSVLRQETSATAATRPSSSRRSETQKRQLMLGNGPDLLVIDEYQMLGDPARGMNYELALALAPQHTRLLLLSGSVANPRRRAEMARARSQRSVQLVQHP